MHIAASSPSDVFVTTPAEDEAKRIARLVHRSLLVEVDLTPKPGLVDRNNNGAHDDMTRATFVASARAIAPWFSLFFLRGIQLAGLPARGRLERVRGDGLACERAMFAATAGVNTHKGSVFAFGLLATAAGRLFGHSGRIERDALCADVAAMCEGLVEADLNGRRTAPATAGERLFRHHGMTGARGEAASGFATVRRHALPVFERVRDETGSRRKALFAAFLELLAVNQDTNLVARGGLAGLAHVQDQARRLRDAGGIANPDFLARLAAFDDDLIARRLSPGGSADLLAVTWFLAHLQPEGQVPTVEARGGGMV
ncbi:triphosphoribosyl-dephospho-CoA synthase CitG [Telmatospirillum sp.]|uniref:triphosphoribosyl-dephospho-CoA synthase CitG n=1 Tax=Telmatospirillum sp. TaxID=2079197 RepID=UPI0028493425|nr:triphosphoribosyl-dephospho-CoA synthase CitG [Telmatospirillum sp.]MDR3437796.1 triphosphoribosyl-dephospho-CoA synthase CitG [Telmatospirillum sp.]